MFPSLETEWLYWCQDSAWSKEGENSHQDWSLFSRASFGGVLLTYFPPSLYCSSALITGQSRKGGNVSLVSELAEHLKFGWVPRWDGFRMIPSCITIPGRAGYVLTLCALLHAGMCRVTAWRAGIMWYRLPSLLLSCSCMVPITTVSEQHVL